MMGWKQVIECVTTTCILLGIRSIWVGSQSQQFNSKHRKINSVNFRMPVSHLPHEVYSPLITISKKSMSILLIFPFLFFTLLWVFYMFSLPFIMEGVHFTKSMLYTCKLQPFPVGMCCLFILPCYIICPA